MEGGCLKKPRLKDLLKDYRKPYCVKLDVGVGTYRSCKFEIEYIITAQLLADLQQKND